MKTFILIISLWVYKGGSGMTAEFNTLEACEYAAAQVLLAHRPNQQSRKGSFAICVPKGDRYAD